MNNMEKTRIAEEIEAFNNTDFTDCPELTDEQLAQLKPSHLRKTVITRKQLHKYIDVMPEYSLSIVGPLLAHFAVNPSVKEMEAP